MEIVDIKLVVWRFREMVVSLELELLLDIILPMIIMIINAITAEIKKIISLGEKNLAF